VNKLKSVTVVAALTLGCTTPTAPTDCFDPDLEAQYERVEGARPGDPYYNEAVRWSAICPEWNLLSE
jgi:hypothetical protein